MKTSTLFIIMMFNALLLGAQIGNTINDPIPVDGTNVSVNLLDYQSATFSALMPMCGSTEDVFYKHVVSSGDNKLTFGMASIAIAVGTAIDFQLLKAPNGDLNNLVEITCDSYPIALIFGGGFLEIVENVSAGDEYYLRVYKPAGLGTLLSTLLNGTSITMMSEFDSTLSIGEENLSGTLQLIVKNDHIKLLNNMDFDGYRVFSLDGKQHSNENSPQLLHLIDISHLDRGLYIVMLENESIYKTYKFLK
ncbi:T9SS type A sorting domain-containing protein [Flavobacteriaceae bacterium LMO-SS05]